MRKKFTLLFAALLAFAGVAKAGVTDLPEMSTEGSIKYYAIKNTRSGKYANYAGDATKMTQVSTTGLSSLFYFTASDAETAEGFTPVMIHNAATANKLEDFDSWTAAGKAWYLHADVQNATAAGFHIMKDAKFEGWNAFNDGGGATITNYAAKDAGSVFEISAVTDFAAFFNVPAVKKAAKAELENLALISVFTAAATEAIAEVEAVEAKGVGMAELNAAVEEVNAIVAACKKESLAGKFFTLFTAGRTQYAKMTATGTAAAATATSPDFIWQFVENNGAYNIYNPYTGKYLGALGSVGGPSIAVTANQAEAGAYNIAVVKDGEDAKVTFGINGAYIHLNGSLLPWYGDGGASYWTIAEVANFTEMVAAYKESSIKTLDSWKSLSVVFDAALVDAAKIAINGINSTDWATFAAIDAELTEVTDAVAAKMFTFQTIATDDGRVNVWISANASTMKAFGAAKDAQDYNAVWSLQHAGGSSFYLYNEKNKVYLGAPVNNTEAVVLTETPAAAYTLEMITDKGDNVVELHSNGGTLHASNHADKKLISWDGNEDASRWMVNVIDVTKDIRDLLATIEAGDYAEDPELGQYPTAAYEALVEASTSAKTVEDVEAAIAAFQKSLNAPVYFITSKHSGYAAGSAILYNGSEWRWAAANKYNKQMWMTIPGYTKADVPAVDAYDADGTSYAICDYLTGTKMRGKDVQIVKVADWEGAYNLQYNADASSTDAAQHAKDNGLLVNWKPGTKDDAQASVWGVEYIGTTYELAELTDEYLAAGVELAAVNVPAFNFAAGVNNYAEEGKPALDAAVAKRAEVLGKFSTAEEIAAAKTQLEEAIAAVELNMPESGHYYRIRCTGDGQKRIQSTIAEGGDRLEMKSGDEGKNEGSIFLYTEGGLMSYTERLFIDAYRFVAEGSDVPQVTFSAAANGAVGCYNINVGGRYIFGANDTIDSGAGNPDNRAGYNWWLEEVAAGDLPNGEITGIANVEVQESTVIYDLLGRRVEKMEKGLYIVNGRKVLVK